MKITSEDQEFMKINRGTIKRLLEGRMTDIMNELVDEESTEKKVLLSLLAKEFRKALIMLENISNTKEKKEPGEKFTGM